MARRQGQCKLTAAISVTPAAEHAGVTQPKDTPSGNASAVRLTKTVRIAQPPSMPKAQPQRAMNRPSSMTMRATWRAVMPTARKRASTRSFCSTPTVSALISMQSAVRTASVSNSGACRLKFCNLSLEN